MLGEGEVEAELVESQGRQFPRRMVKYRFLPQVQIPALLLGGGPWTVIILSLSFSVLSAKRD